MKSKIIKLVNNTKAIFKFDDKPKAGSDALVTSGTIYSALNDMCPFKKLQLDELSKMDTEQDMEDNTIVHLSSIPEVSSWDPESINSLKITMGEDLDYRSMIFYLTQISSTEMAYQENSYNTVVLVKRNTESEPWKWDLVLTNNTLDLPGQTS